MFIQTITTVSGAIFQLFLISFAAGLLVRRRIVSNSQVKALSEATVNIFLPCLIMAKTLIRFRPEEFGNWWLLPVAGLIILILGLLFSAVLFRLNPEKRPFMTLASMQNAIYIPLPIGQILFPDQFDLFALYCFLVALGLNPFMWSVGKVMLSGGKKTRIQLRDFITPPLAAIFISIALVFSGLSSHIPGTLIASMDLLGQATVPLAVFVLGATIGAISFRDMPLGKDIFIVSGVKFVLIPLAVFVLLYFTKFHSAMPLFCSLMMIQACSPPATNLILIVKTYGGDVQAVSGMMLIQYLLSILAMPLWIALWQSVQ
ncbi:AEC family transporter [Desulfospira joergensenii]|uniref:AEC family transporter n=1 Tax=Desulfospira joergensenii TaxID=53329 RepID=UPI0003B5FEAD|nr:AEC family transporter [Desulfospira joergensenii]